MTNQYWSWLLGIVGLVGFFLAGRRVWWAWYVNLANQAFWLVYSIVTQQYGFLVTTFFYAAVFSKNAYAWTREHQNKESARPLKK